MALADERTARRGKTRSGTLVATLCACAIMFDGYDLSVFGTTIPALLAYEPWGLDAAQVGVIASAALMGMLVGTLVCGIATDLLGRRRMLMASVTVFSLFMVGCALAPSAELFGLFRFLAGIGLGGLIPTGIALTVEFAPPHRRNFASALVSSSFSIGTIGAALLGIWVLPAYGSRPMYLVGALPLLVLLPLAYRKLPESVSYLATRAGWTRRAAWPASSACRSPRVHRRPTTAARPVAPP